MDSNNHPASNGVKPVFVGGQWVKATTGKWRYDAVVCRVATAPGCQAQAKVHPMTYSSRAKTGVWT
jgi:hypothetical protein